LREELKRDVERDTSTDRREGILAGKVEEQQIVIDKLKGLLDGYKKVEKEQEKQLYLQKE